MKQCCSRKNRVNSSKVCWWTNKKCLGLYNQSSDVLTFRCIFCLWPQNRLQHWQSPPHSSQISCPGASIWDLQNASSRWWPYLDNTPMKGWFKSLVVLPSLHRLVRWFGKKAYFLPFEFFCCCRFWSLNSSTTLCNIHYWWFFVFQGSRWILFMSGIVNPLLKYRQTKADLISSTALSGMIMQNSGHTTFRYLPDVSCIPTF